MVFSECVSIMYAYVFPIRLGQQQYFLCICSLYLLSTYSVPGLGLVGGHVEMGPEQLYSQRNMRMRPRLLLYSMRRVMVQPGAGAGAVPQVQRIVRDADPALWLGGFPA